jgi:hypothetical protein
VIAGRPTNLWLGLATSIVGFATVVAVAAGVDPTLVANVAGAGSGVLGAAILLIANQPPTVLEGSKINISTPNGDPNRQITV